MKKILSTLLFLPALAMAEVVSFESYCVSLEKLTEVITKHKEQPMLSFISHREYGGGNNVKQYVTVLFVNPETKTYTIAERVKEDSYCVTSVGADIVPSTTRLDFDKKN